MSSVESSQRQQKLKNRKRLKLWGLWLVVFGLFVLSLRSMNVDLERIVDGSTRFAAMVASMFPPSAEVLFRIPGLALETFQVAVVGTALGIVLSLIIGVLGAHNITPHRSVEVVCKSFAAFTRAVPALIWALLFIVAVGLGPLPGVLALGINSIGMLGKVFSETIEEVDAGGIEAVRASGGTPLQVITKAVIPVVTPAFVSWTLFRLDINLRYSSVLGVVGAGGIGLELVRSTRMGDFAGALTVVLVIFAMVWFVETVNNHIRAFIR